MRTLYHPWVWTAAASVLTYKGTPLKNSPADRGRDIVAQQLRDDVDQTKHLEAWFVDCKHYKKAVPPTEMQNLLTWAEAERPDVALFMVSGYLSNAAKDYLESYRRNNKPPFKIKHWELPQLERMTKKKQTLLRKHKLSDLVRPKTTTHPCHQRRPGQAKHRGNRAGHACRHEES